MGLDSYLHRDIYVGNSPTIAIVDCSSKVKLERVKRITEDIGYWRKANAIHGWFVEYAADGDMDATLKGVHVSWELLKELKATCLKVLADPTLAEELLPVQQGFFFGSYEYDQDYLDDLQYTVDIITDVEGRLFSEWDDFEYSASW